MVRRSAFSTSTETLQGIYKAAHKTQSKSSYLISLENAIKIILHAINEVAASFHLSQILKLLILFSFSSCFELLSAQIKHFSGQNPKERKGKNTSAF